MKDLVIFDLDGCISDDRHRRHLLPDYDAYHNQCVNDPPANQRHFRRVVDESIVTPVFVTGRCVTQYNRTLQWLHEHFGVVGAVMFMRPERDTTPAPQLKLHLLDQHVDNWENRVAIAFDDRDDVLAAYANRGVHTARLRLPPTADEILQEMADTFRIRNAVYGSNYKQVGPLVKLLWPDGVPQELITTDHWHLFELILVKLSRFANQDLNHVDSIHDIAVYAAMIESIIRSDQ